MCRKKYQAQDEYHLISSKNLHGINHKTALQAPTLYTLCPSSPLVSHPSISARDTPPKGKTQHSNHRARKVKQRNEVESSGCTVPISRVDIPHSLHKNTEGPKKQQSSIPPLINPHLQILFSFNVAADDRTRSARVIIREQSSLFLHIVFVFVSEQTMGHGWGGSRG